MEIKSGNGQIVVTINVPPASDWHESSTGTTMLGETGSEQVLCHGVPCVLAVTLRTTKQSKAAMAAKAKSVGKVKAA